MTSVGVNSRRIELRHVSARRKYRVHSTRKFVQRIVARKLLSQQLRPIAILPVFQNCAHAVPDLLRVGISGLEIDTSSSPANARRYHILIFGFTGDHDWHTQAECMIDRSISAVCNEYIDLWQQSV